LLTAQATLRFIGFEDQLAPPAALLRMAWIFGGMAAREGNAVSA
jgi:hypothetical protein